MLLSLLFSLASAPADGNRLIVADGDTLTYSACVQAMLDGSGDTSVDVAELECDQYPLVGRVMALPASSLVALAVRSLYTPAKETTCYTNGPDGSCWSVR